MATLKDVLVFNPATGEMIFPSRPGRAGHRPAAPQRDEPASDHQEGDAADAIRDAEAVLVHQNSATAQLDLQVITAVLNAHEKTAEGSEALDALKHDVEVAVRTRSDLDTPAGARDFQRFLVGKLTAIRAVVASASLDDTSKSALMAAWTSLYNFFRPGESDASERCPSTDGPTSSPTERAGQSRPIAADAGLDPSLDSLSPDDSGLLPEDIPAQISPASMPTTPATAGIPSFGGGAMPGGGAVPAGAPGWAMPSGFPLPGALQAGPLQGTDDERSPQDLDDGGPKFNDPQDELSSGKKDDDQADHEAVEPMAAEPPPSGPTVVTLPNGETVIAASPQLAAAIKASANGVPIAEAFRQQGITIPPPGTAVSEPVDPSQIAPGDIGMFTNRHALALGQSKALLNGQIQHISTVTGPSFLGWEHPPEPVTTTAPVRTEPPAPTRPATTGRP
jgi:Domain of unknown function (DUF4226)